MTRLVAASVPPMPNQTPVLPPGEPGVTWRPAKRDDADAIARLIDACFEVEGGYRITAGEVLTEFDMPDGDPERDTLVGVDQTGELIALGWVIVPAGAESTFRVFDWNFVRPDARGRGIGTFLLNWWEHRGRQLASQSDLPGFYRQHPYDWQTDRIDLLNHHGYRAERYFVELARDLREPIAEPQLPNEFRFEPWSAKESEPARLVSNVAFADHWGSEPIDPGRWQAMQDEFFHPPSSGVVYAGDRPVGFVTGATYPHDFEDRGRTEGWIERIGTVSAYRGRGLATGFLTRAMLAFRTDGLEFAVLGADSSNETGAMALYERLGFVAEKRAVAYVKPIPG